MIEVPEGWEIKPFSSLASINMGQSPESEFVNENQEGIAFLQGNADFGDINPKELYWVKVPKKLAKKDDILISVRAPVGDINMADKEYCIGRGLSALTIKKINQKFGFYELFLLLSADRCLLLKCLYKKDSILLVGVGLLLE